MNAQSTLQDRVIESNPMLLFAYVKCVTRSARVKFLIAAGVMSILVTVPLMTGAHDYNESNPTGHLQHQRKTLTGNWLVTVTRINPPPTLPPTFLSLMTCFEDGNVSEESNTTSIRSTGHGNWEKSGHHQFTRLIHYFRFDSARNYLGTGRITATITLSEEGSEFEADAMVQTFDSAGNLLTTLQSTEVGQRL